MIYLFDKNEILTKAVTQVYAHTQTAELNGLITARAEIAFEDYNGETYFGAQDIGEPKNIFWLYKITKVISGDTLITLEGILSFFDDLQGIVVRDKRPQNVSAAIAFGGILEDTRWSLGTVQTTGTASTNFYYISALSAFMAALGVWQVEFRPRMVFADGMIVGRYVDLYDKLSGDYGKWYEYGDKLISVVAEQSRDKVYTAFLGRGKGEQIFDATGEPTGFGRKLKFDEIEWSVQAGDPVDKPLGQDYIVIPEAAEYRYSDGTDRMAVVDFDDIETPEELLRATYEYGLQNCFPKVQLKSHAIDDSRIELGETCAIIRTDNGIRYKTRIFKITRDFVNSKNKTFEFGDKIVLSVADRFQNTQKTIEAKGTEFESYIAEVAGQITSAFFNEDGYNYEFKAGNAYGLPAGYYSFDRPITDDPTKLIYVGAGKLMIANSKNPDGTWHFSTFGTGDGFTADLINAGMIRGGSSFWDLENGNIHIGNETQFLKYSAENGLQISVLGDYETKSEAIAHRGALQSQIDVNSGLIATQVSRTDEIDESLSQRISGVEQSASDIRIAVTRIETDGVNKVRTEKGYTFDDQGLTITDTDSEIVNKIDNTGMEVSRDNVKILEANNEGVNALNLTSRQFLIIGGNARLQDYEGDRTGVFYIGG